MGNLEAFPVSTNEDDDLFSDPKLIKMRHRRSQSLEGLTLTPQALSKKGSQRSSFLSYIVKESSFATLSVDEDGNKTLNEYVMMSTLGDGSFGKALKILNKSILKSKLLNGQPALDTAKKEVVILKRLHHRNIVKLHEVIDDPSNDILYIVMEYVENGQVWNFGDPPIPLERSRKYLFDILAGLEYLHNANVVHRDIKPANLLLDHTDTVKLSDFGVSELVPEDDDSLSQYAGTPAFQSPEAIEGGTFSGKLADIWAVGVTLYLFVFGELPFNGDSHKDIWTQIQSKTLVYPDSLDPDLKDLLEKILEKDPTKRLKISEIRRHQWMSHGKQNALYDEIEKGLIKEIEVEEKPKKKPRGKSVHDVQTPKIQISVEAPKRPHHQHTNSSLTSLHMNKKGDQGTTTSLSSSPSGTSNMETSKRDSSVTTPRGKEFMNRAIVLTEDSTNSSDEALDWWDFIDTTVPHTIETKQEKRHSKDKISLFSKLFSFGTKQSPSTDKTRTFDDKTSSTSSFKREINRSILTSPRERKGSIGKKEGTLEKKEVFKKDREMSTPTSRRKSPSSPPQSEDEFQDNEHVVLFDFLKAEKEKAEKEKPEKLDKSPQKMSDRKLSPSQSGPIAKTREIEVFNRSPSQKLLTKPQYENFGARDSLREEIKGEEPKYSMNEKLPTIPDSPLAQVSRKDSVNTMSSPSPTQTPTTPKFSVPKKNSPRYGSEKFESPGGTPEGEMDMYSFFQEMSKGSPQRNFDKTSNDRVSSHGSWRSSGDFSSTNDGRKNKKSSDPDSSPFTGTLTPKALDGRTSFMSTFWNTKKPGSSSTKLPPEKKE